MLLVRKLDVVAQLVAEVVKRFGKINIYELLNNDNIRRTALVLVIN